ncbi:MAG TPA: alkaline phosphatase [Candidatus Angelobacter sp.]|nr:alkaline phosphatase [Candidatus Angelobacter sp.]
MRPFKTTFILFVLFIFILSIPSCELLAQQPANSANPSGGSGNAAAAQLQQLIQTGRAKNVIFLLGDGMGDSEITAARNYYVGAAGRLAMDTLPFTGAVTTYSLQEKDPSKPDYVTDSAAGGTAWATGLKTSNGRISTTAGTDKTAKTILEIAKEQGYRTGNISTAEITDATPAVLGSHVNSRGCQGPEDMKNCPQYKKNATGPGSNPLGSIAEQLIDHKIDVLMGGGKQRFDQTIDGGQFQGKRVLAAAEDLGYKVVTSAQELTQVSAGKQERLLGLFNAGNMSMEWNGDPAIPFPGSGPQKCNEFVRPSNEPALLSMMLKAIQLLENNDPKAPGFFLQVEGAQIDKRAHTAQPCEQIGETVAFDNTIKLAIDYANAHPGTLVIVTADHGHSTQIVPPQAQDSHASGLMSTLITSDKANMTLHYGTNTVCCSATHTMEHAGTQVRIAAQGPQAFGVLGVHDMSEIFHLMARALGAE